MAKKPLMRTLRQAEANADGEEKQRLTNHLGYFRETMQNGTGQGKKLSFIT